MSRNMCLRLRRIMISRRRFWIMALVIVGLIVVGIFNNLVKCIWAPKSNLITTEDFDMNYGLKIQSKIKIPPWVQQYKNFGLIKNSSLDKIDVTSSGMDEEESTAWDNFFYGTTGGLMLEMGAMNGVNYSVSHFFESSANWKIILIEGNPSLASQMSENRPQSLNLNLIICDKPKIVHFITCGDLGGIDGVLEYMSVGYLRTFYPELINESEDGSSLDWEKVKVNPSVRQLQCLPLATILAPFKINHVNFFVLDVEGGEVDILKTIDFDRISFDVIAVETDRGVDGAEITDVYVERVCELLISKGYLLWDRNVGRNSWFVHPNFIPFKKSDRTLKYKPLLE